MSDIANAIMDAAERRIRDAGYNGFSFRELAADVGVKSSSVHYHFPTKELLAAKVARRYVDRFMVAVAEKRAAGIDPSEAWRQVFRKALIEDNRMCLCGTLGAAARDIPREVLVEAQRFFQLGADMLVDAGLTRRDAMKLLANLEGAMLIANAMGDSTIFDAVTA